MRIENWNCRTALKSRWSLPAYSCLLYTSCYDKNSKNKAHKYLISHTINHSYMKQFTKQRNSCLLYTSAGQPQAETLPGRISADHRGRAWRGHSKSTEEWRNGGCMTTLCFAFGRTQTAPSLFLCGFRKNWDFAGISLGYQIRSSKFYKNTEKEIFIKWKKLKMYMDV